MDSLKDENDSLKCEIEAYKNELDVIRQEHSTELLQKSKQLSLLHQTLRTMQEVSLTISTMIKTSLY